MYSSFLRCLPNYLKVRFSPQQVLQRVQYPTPQCAQHHQLSTFRSNDMPRLVNRKYGEKAPSLFSEAEYRGRHTRLRSYMADQDIDAVILTSYHNINYYCGLIFYRFARPYAVIVTQDDNIIISSAIDAAMPWRKGYGENCSYTDWHKDNFYYAVKENVRNTSGKIGLEFDDVTVENFTKYQEAFQGNLIVDVGGLAMRLRLLKSPEEISVMRQGARIAELGCESAMQALHEGVMEYEVAQAATDTMIREIARCYPQTDLMDTMSWCQSGPNSDGGHNPVTTRRIQKGDGIIINTFPMIQGYYTALERTVFLDHVSDAHLKYWQANCDVHKRGCELIQPGAVCSDIAHELNAMFREKDLLQYRSFGYGHSFGTLCHYYGREADLELREDIDTVLEPGMVLSMEPMITIPPGQPGAGGYREHDIFIVTEHGSENITPFPYGPEHNVIRK